MNGSNAVSKILESVSYDILGFISVVKGVTKVCKQGPPSIFKYEVDTILAEFLALAYSLR